MSGTRERRLLLLGGSSEIALAIAQRLAVAGLVRPLLVGRDQAALERSLAVLEESGCARGEFSVLDADELDRHAEVIGEAFARFGGFDVVVLAVGVLGGQAGLDAGTDEALEVMRVGFDDCGSLLLHSMRKLREQGSGTMVVLSSVAAERPRASNPLYGAAKSGLDALAQALGDAAAADGVRVLVVRPGFVHTRMTAGLEPAPFATTPEAVADAVVRGLQNRSHTVWVPGRLRIVFSVLRHLPRGLYRRLPL